MISQKTLMVGLLAAIWGANFPVSQSLLQSMDVLTVRFTSSLISLGVYSLLFCYQVKYLIRLTWPEVKRILLLSIPTIFLVPLLNLYALSYLSSASALLLIYTMPAMTSLVMVLLGKSQMKGEFVPIVLSVIGVLFVVGLPFSFGLGEGIILLSALIWAVGGLLNQKLMPSVPLSQVSFIQLFFVSLCNIAVLVIFTDPQWSEVIASSVENWLGLLYVGVIAGGLAFYLWFWLIKAYGASVASYCTLWSPILGLFIIAAGTQTQLGANLLIGGACIILSIFIKNFLVNKGLKIPKAAYQPLDAD